MPVLRPEPGLFDLPGWHRRLEELRADPDQDDWQQALIDHALAHIRAISGGADTPSDSAAEHDLTP